MKFHRLFAYKLYRRFDKVRSEYELLKIEHDGSGALGMLETLFTRFHAPLKTETLENFVSLAENQDGRDLAQLFSSYGSDKSTIHNYHYIYEYLLRGKRNAALQILEIGLGTHHPDVPSNMGAEGKPGASLRAFRDWAPHAMIFGADVDQRVLFSENRISTYYVDQLQTDTLRELASRFSPGTFDLLIDDGLHTPEANVNFLNTALDLVKDDGRIVIEDVAEKHLSFWSFVSWALEGRFEVRFIKTRHSCVVVLRKIAGIKSLSS